MRGAFSPPDDREVFELPLLPTAADFDENGHVNNVVYVRWLQEVGTAHWNSRFSLDERSKWSWVALRHEIDYRRPLLPGEQARARTWVGEPQGPRFDRFVVIEGPDGAICAQGRTTWCLIDADSRRPVRIPAGLVEPLRRPARTG